jgi:hypothetical protein
VFHIAGCGKCVADGQGEQGAGERLTNGVHVLLLGRQR